MSGSHAHDHSGHHHGPGGHSHDYSSTNKTRVLIAAILTGGFMIAEAIGGIVTGSLALLADAGHMMTDSVSLLFAWYAFVLAGKAASKYMTFGYDRVKTLVAFINGLTILLIGLWICYEAWERIGTPAPVLGGPMLIIAILGLCVNIGAFFVLHGGDKDNLNMRGAILHVLGDLLGSVAAIVAALVIMATGWTPIDPILSVFVALILFKSAGALVLESGRLLLEGAPSSHDRDAIAADLTANVAGLKDVHHMHLWSLDGSKNMATLHANLNDGADPYATIRAIKARLAAEHGVKHATVEPEIGDCADAEDHDHAAHDDHDHAGHDHAADAHKGHSHAGADHSGHDHKSENHKGHDHSKHKH